MREPHHDPRRAFDGEGAARYGGRWNPPGYRVVYTSESLALAAFERLVHLVDRRGLEGLWMLGYALEEGQVAYLEPLPPDWDRKPRPVDWHLPPWKNSQRAGALWLDRRASLALRVPSATLPESHNYLLNPQHPDFSPDRVILLGRFRFDERVEEMLKQAFESPGDPR